MMDEDEAEYMRLVEALKAEAGRLSGLGAGIVAGLALDIASDSRTFARVFGLAHALVLRELTALAQTGDYVRIRQGMRARSARITNWGRQDIASWKR